MLKSDEFIKLCEEVGLNVVLRKKSNDTSILWEDVFVNLSYQSVFYLGSSIEYYLAYERGHGWSCEDFSCIIFWDKKPISLWPVTVSNKDGAVNFTSQGRDLLPPIFVKACSHKLMKNISILVFRIVEKVLHHIGINKLISAPAFDGSNALKNWHTLLMKNGAKCYLRHNLYVDLSLPYEKIKSFFRKSYKSLITAGERIWNVETLSISIDIKVWEEFRLLHKEVSQGITRSIETWNLPYHSLLKGSSFLITVRDNTSRMVGGGLFVITKDEGIYSIGAYDRNLFDKPIGHVVQNRAIQEMQKRGCRWYFIGQRFYPTDELVPSDKELSISNFKEGFSTHCFPRFKLVKIY